MVEFGTLNVHVERLNPIVFKEENKQETKGPRRTKMAHCLETLMELNENNDDKEDDDEYRNDLYRGHYPEENEINYREEPLQYDFDNEKTQEDSSYLSHLMDLVVGSPDTIRHRQEYCRIYDHFCHYSKENNRAYFTGSKAEGLDLPGSDLDYMDEDSSILVLQSHEYEESSTLQRDVLIMETNHVRPCFTLLRCASVLSDWLLRSVQPMDNMLYLSSYLYVLSNKETNSATTQIIQGPSLETYNEYSIEGFDYVHCMKCDFWPLQADEWLHRHRPSGWPSDYIIQKIQRKGCHLVGVGHPLSERKEMEWRLSFSIAERELVWSFNHVQIQCYAFLKLILKQYIKPRMNESILCSYFVKTIMFWEIESQSICVWAKRNLTTCFTHLIRKLYEHVVTGHLRHYFISDFNLFEIKVKSAAQRRLKEIIEPLVNLDITSVMSKCESLCRIVELYRMAYSFRLQAMHMVDNATGVMTLTEDMRFSRQASGASLTYWMMDSRIGIRSLQTLDSQGENVYFDPVLQQGIIETAKHLLTRDPFHFRNKCLYRVFRELSCSHTAVHTTSKTIFKATWLFYNRNFSKCLIVISNMRQSTFQCCLYYSGRKINNPKYHVENYVELIRRNPSLYKPYKKFWVFDIHFSTKDMDIVPAALQVELVYCYPSAGIWISPFVYLFYLQFLCFHGLYDHINRDGTLRQLMETVNSDELVGGLESRLHSYNIAGHCLWLLGRYSEARDMFILSVQATIGTPLEKYNSAYHYMNLLGVSSNSQNEGQ